MKKIIFLFALSFQMICHAQTMTVDQAATAGSHNRMLTTSEWNNFVRSIGFISSGGSAWSTTGNTIGVSDFIGGINAAPLRFRTNNVEAMRLNTDGSLAIGYTSLPTSAKLTVNGNVGIGTNAPASNLHVAGTFQNDLTTYSFLNTSSLQGSGIKFVGGMSGSLTSSTSSYNFGINNLLGSNAVGFQWQKNSLDIQAGFRSDSAEHWVQSFFTCGTNGVRRLNRFGLYDSTYAIIDLTKAGGYHSRYYADYDSTSILAPAFKINAPVRINDGTQGSGKVFTSDATGLGSWVSNVSSQWTTNASDIYFNSTLGNYSGGEVAIGGVPAASLALFQVIDTNVTTPNAAISTYNPNTSAYIFQVSSKAAVTIKDGSQGLNKVFTSNASGLGTWATPTVSLTSQVSGTLPIANGGTNATIANTALNNILPSQSGKSNYLWYSDGTNTNLTNTPSVSNITASGAVTTNTLTVNGNRLSNQRIGTIFSDNVSTAGNYTVTTTNGSATFATGCTLTGNTGNFSKTKITYKYNSSLANTGVGIFLNNYVVSSKFVVTANTTASYGAGIGLDQYGNNTWAVMMSNKSGTTRGTIYIVDPIDSSIKATSATALSYTNSTDTIYLEWRFEKNTIYATAKNITTPTVVTASVTVPNVATVVWSPSPNVSPTIFRAGRPAIYSYSGTQIYTNLSLSSEQFTNPKIALIGDSQVLGLGASDNSKTYASYLGFGIDNKQMIWAAGGAEVADLHNSFSELSNILNGEHAYIPMFIGGNDVIQGRTLSQIQGDYLNLLNDILNAGCIPLPGKICYVKSTYSNAATINAGITALNTWIGTLPFKILDENTSTSTGGNMNPIFTTDGGHFNDYGCIVWAKTLATQLAPIYQTNNDFSRGGWIDFSGLLTNTGWAATPSPNAESFSLSANGTIMKVKLYISGTSNSATTSLSIPFTSTSRANSYSLNPIGIIDNGGTEVWGNAQVNPSQTIIVLYKDPAGTTCTATGAKTAIGQLEFEIQ